MVEKLFDMSTGFSNPQGGFVSAEVQSISAASSGPFSFDMLPNIVPVAGVLTEWPISHAGMEISHRPVAAEPEGEVEQDFSEPGDGSEGEEPADADLGSGWIEQPPQRSRFGQSSSGGGAARLFVPGLVVVCVLAGAGFVYYVFFGGQGPAPQAAYHPPVTPIVGLNSPPAATADNPMSPSLALPGNLTNGMNPQSPAQAKAAPATAAPEASATTSTSGTAVAPPNQVTPVQQQASTAEMPAPQQVASAPAPQPVASAPAATAPVTNASVSTPTGDSSAAKPAPEAPSAPPTNYATVDQVNHLTDLLGQVASSVATLNAKIDGTQTTDTQISTEMAGVSDKLAAVALTTNQIAHQQTERLTTASPEVTRHQAAGSSAGSASNSNPAGIASKQVLKEYDLRGYSATNVVVGTPYGSVTVPMNGTVPGAGDVIGVYQYAPGPQGIELVTTEGVIRPAPATS